MRIRTLIALAASVALSVPAAFAAVTFAEFASAPDKAVVSIDGVNVVVRVGAVEHPSTPAHYIEWIAIQTTSGTQRKKLDPGDLPKAEFSLAQGEKLVAAYEYCNLHGLWKSQR